MKSTLWVSLLRSHSSQKNRTNRDISLRGEKTVDMALLFQRHPYERVDVSMRSSRKKRDSLSRHLQTLQGRWVESAAFKAKELNFVRTPPRAWFGFAFAAVPGMRIFLGGLFAAIIITQPCHVERRPAFWTELRHLIVHSFAFSEGIFINGAHLFPAKRNVFQKECTKCGFS